MVTVNTSKGAMAAIQDLRVVGQTMAKSQTAIATGSKVSTVQGSASSWVLAKQTSSDISAYNRVIESIDRASAMLDTAMAAGEAIMDLLNQMKPGALQVWRTQATSATIDALNTDYERMKNQISSLIANASFDGANMLSASPASAIALGDADGNNKIEVGGVNFSFSGPILKMPAYSRIDSTWNASVAAADINSTMIALGNQMATWAAGAKRLENHRDLTTKIQLALDSSFSSMNDADFSTESAKLKAAQTREQLTTQAFSVANSTTRSALSLFS